MGLIKKLWLWLRERAEQDKLNDDLMQWWQSLPLQVKKQIYDQNATQN